MWVVLTQFLKFKARCFMYVGIYVSARVKCHLRSSPVSSRSECVWKQRYCQANSDRRLEPHWNLSTDALTTGGSGEFAQQLYSTACKYIEAVTAVGSRASWIQVEIRGQIFQLLAAVHWTNLIQTGEQLGLFNPTVNKTQRSMTRGMFHTSNPITLALREERLPGGSQSTHRKRQPDVCVHSTGFYWLVAWQTG